MSRTDVVLTHVAVVAVLLLGLLLWDTFGTIIVFDAIMTFCM